MLRALLGLALLAALAACDEGSASSTDAGTDAGPVWDPACDNTDPAHCLLPWPSDHFLVDGRITLPAQGMPTNVRGERARPGPFSREGFSLVPTLMTVVSPAPDPAVLFGEDRIEASLGPDATAVLVNVETNERVPCFAELDQWPDIEPDRVPLYVRPAVRLEPGTRYAVGLRRLRTADGTPIEPSPFFRALRDGTALEGSDVEARRGDLDDVFEALEDTGFARDEIIMAWGFTTAPLSAISRDLVAMRDGMLALPAGACAIDRVDDADEGDTLPEGIWRRVHGTVRVPLYLGGVEPMLDQSWIVRDAEGLPVRGELAAVPFTALLPESLRERVREGRGPGRAIVYGHGILGSRDEASSRWMASQAAELEAAIFATDWWGMSRDDLARIVLALTRDFGDFAATTERMHQGVLNVLALARAVRETCVALPELAVPLDGGASAPAYDPAEVHFYGNSMGAILGAVVAALSPDVERFVLGVGGAAWSMLIKRSDAWRNLGGVLATGYADPLERALLAAMVALLFDPVDGGTYAPHLVRDPLPGAIEHRVLLQIGIGDVAVSNLTAHLLARSAGIPLTVPSVDEPYGLETTTAEDPPPSALTIFALEGVEPLPPGSRDPGPDTPTHNGVRNLPAARAQIDAFLRTDGVVVHPCDGACDPD